jgi:competence protein ComEC
MAAAGVSAGGLLYSFKERLRRVAGVLLPEPESSFLLGLLIGERQGIPDNLAEAFRRTGTSHILAVSGYNVSRLVDIFFILFACAAVRRRRAAGLVAVAILGFVAVVGGGASVVRAAVMGCTSLLAAGLGRRYSGLGALLAAAAVMLAANPLILRHDIGFQLSFAAVWGMHALGQPLTRRLVFVPEAFGLRQTMGETLAATLMTTPVVLQAFGRLPLIGPLVNLLVLPLVPWAMFAGGLAVLLGSFHAAAGLPLAFLAGLTLRLIEGIILAASYIAPLNIAVVVGPVAAAALYFWIWLLWFALSRAKPVVLFGRTGLPDMEVEVIDHGL